MPAVNITAKFVAQVPLPEVGRVYYTDIKLPGFAICVSSTGSKVFYRIGRTHAGATRTKLERYPKITVEKARELCVQVHADILEGKPPRTRLAKSAKTVRYVWEWHLKNNLKPHNKTWLVDELTYKRTIAQKWDNLPIRDLSRTMITEEATRIFTDNGPGAANMFLSVLRGICKAARAEDWISRNPAEQVRKFHIQKRSRFIDTDEIEPFFTNLDKLKPVKRDYFLVSLFTAARRSNVCAMAWNDINLERAVWTIRGDEAKKRSDIVLPLADLVMDILRRRRIGNDTPWVFPSYGKTGHLVEPKNQWQKLLRNSGLNDLRMHDLRRTLASWQSIAGEPLQTIGASLGHGTDLSATLIYARLNTAVVRKSIQNTVDNMTLIVESKKIENSQK